MKKWLPLLFLFILGSGFEARSQNLFQAIKHLSSEMVSEADFIKVSQYFYRLYGPIAKVNGGKLRLDSNWQDDSHEAHAGKNNDDWLVYIAGRIARNIDANLDSLNFTLCHEFGHQLGGYPFVNRTGNIWNTKEGQTDYYAAFVCARHLWKDQLSENAKFAYTVDAYANSQCDLAWSTFDDRNLC